MRLRERRAATGNDDGISHTTPLRSALHHKRRPKLLNRLGGVGITLDRFGDADTRLRRFLGLDHPRIAFPLFTPCTALAGAKNSWPAFTVTSGLRAS
jgi:hypothetical protein